MELQNINKKNNHSKHNKDFWKPEFGQKGESFMITVDASSVKLPQRKT